MIIAQARPVDYEKAKEIAKGKAPTKPVVHLSKYNLRKIWDNYEIIKDVQIDDGRFIRVAAGTLNGFRYVSLRLFYYHKRDDVYKPAKQGIRIPMISPFFAESTSNIPVIKDVGEDFLESFVKAFAVANTMELADRANAVYIQDHYEKHTAVKMKEIGNE